MERIHIPARPDWRNRLLASGCNFAEMYGAPYMSEALPVPAAYRMSEREVESLQQATRELHTIALAVTEHAVQSEEAMQLLGIPGGFADVVAESWKRSDPDLYQRMDLCLDPRDKQYKLFEYNGDTPTGVVEMNCNLAWWQDATELKMIPQGTDVFNDFRYHLTERFTQLRPHIGDTILHFASVKDNDEEGGTVHMLKAYADDAGLFTELCHLEDIRANDNHDLFVAAQGATTPRIDWLFKLFPWEDMATGVMAEDFRRTRTCRFLEPAWKMTWSNKAFLVLAWKLFEGHPNLLPAYMEGDAGASALTRYIRKPQWGREGQNMQIIEHGKVVRENAGGYGSDRMIIQDLLPMQSYDGAYPILGSWVIGGEPAGVLIREDANPITGDMSFCLPTFIH